MKLEELIDIQEFTYVAGQKNLFDCRIHIVDSLNIEQIADYTDHLTVGHIRCRTHELCCHLGIGCFRIKCNSDRNNIP
jgi:hypothetical protein